MTTMQLTPEQAEATRHEIINIINGGGPNGTNPDDCGAGWGWIAPLREAYAEGGQPAALRVYYAACEVDKNLHALMTAGEAPRRRIWLTEDEIDQLEPPTWLVNEIIPAGEVTMVFGPGDAGKTFILVDVMARVARFYPCLYIAGEDAPGIKVRKEAWHVHHRAERSGRFYMVPESVSLFDSKAVDAFITDIHPLGLRIILVDTLSQCITGADENSNQDMGIVLANCQRIARETGAAVVLIHHTTKDGANYRGASVLKNNTYGLILVERDDDLIRMECVRIKNTRPFRAKFFRLVEVDTGLKDKHGNPIVSCVIAPAHKVDTRRSNQVTGNMQKVLERLLEMTDAVGGAKTTELLQATGLAGRAFYGTLKALRERGYVSKGEAHTAPLTITSAGRQALAAASDNPNYHDSNDDMPADEPFEVNQLL